MSANYCEARHKATGKPETHCFHLTGQTGLARPAFREVRPIEECCWCGDQTYGLVVPKKHGPWLTKIGETFIKQQRLRAKKRAKRSKKK